MRRRSAAHNILSALLLLSATLSAQYTYIVKFTASAPDASVLLSTLRSAVAKTVPNRSLPSLSVVPLSTTTRRSVSAFPWDHYRRIESAVPFSQAALAAIAAEASVASIEPVHRYTVESIPNDSAYSSQWNLRRIGVAALYENGSITDSLPTVIVGVIDTGIDELHPDLSTVIAVNPGEYGNGKESNGIDDDGNGFTDDWRGYDFVTDSSSGGGDNDPADAHGHGTSVAGIIGARAHNTIGIAGIAPVRLLPLRAFDRNGNGTDIDIAAALIYAAENGADVVNMSFGDVIRSTFLNDAIAFAASRNVIMVASSGNDGSAALHFPSDLPAVISTGSVSRFDSRSIFSSHSPSLDIMAPGEQIPTTVMGGGYTEQFSGTSAAAPHVSAVCALVRSFDKARIRTSPGTPLMSIEEIAGVIMNTASDAGAPGWDEYYGAGIIDAANAIAAAAGTRAVIHSPVLDEQIVTASVPVIVSTIGPAVASVVLSVGNGESPAAWSELYRSSGRMFLHDTLTVWNTSKLTAGTYILRLQVMSNKGTDLEFRQRVQIDTAAPRVTDFRFRDSVIIGTSFGALIEVRTDRNTEGILSYRKQGSGPFQQLRSSGVQRHHQFLLSPSLLETGATFEFRTEFTERSAMHRTVRFPTTAAAGFELFTVKLTPPSIPTTGFTKNPFTLPAGYLLNAVSSVLGKQSVVMNAYGADGDFGTTKLYGFSADHFTLLDSTSRSWIPRAFAPASPSEPPSLWMQDHGISRLFRLDTMSGKIFTGTVWGDSSDVWAAGMADLDGDGTTELLARSSSEYLVYKKSGASYSVISRLPNPSPPLAGESRNQFGPPKAVVGNFTNGSTKELVVADYDGDVLLYRQATPTSLDFTIAAIDTTDLYEMSDQVVKGDFNGDGIPDLAVAGHSGLDWNDDREYNAPVWTVRVYSHRPSDAAGSLTLIWQQHFYGVLTGSGNDNGLSAGKLSATDAADALLISFSPNLYVFQWDASLNTFRSVWTHPASSNAVITQDIDGDGNTDLGFRNGASTEFWSRNDVTVPTAPYAVSAVSRSASSVIVRWSGTASQYRVYRGTKSDSLILRSTVNGNTTFIDTTVAAGVRYFYSVTGVTGQESGRSIIVSAVPRPPMVIVGLEQANAEQMTVALSADISAEAAASFRFLVDGNIGSKSIVRSTVRSVVLTLPTALPPGPHTIRIVQAVDADGMPADTSALFAFSTMVADSGNFYIRSAELTDGRTIRLTFNLPFASGAARTIASYTVRTAVRLFTITSVDSVSASTILLRMADADLRRIAVRIEISADRSVTSTGGLPLNGGRGQVISIAQEPNGLDDIVVFPNPARSGQLLSFINVPRQIRIRIYTPAGNLVTVLESDDAREGLRWDLRDGEGRLVSTGIYLYRIEQLDASGLIAGTRLGKIAVLR